MTSLILYLFIGVLNNIIGPLSKKINTEIKSVKKPSLAYLLSEKPPIPFWRKFLFELTLRILTVLFYPIFYVIIIIDSFGSKKKKVEVLHRNLNDNLLYFWRMSGAGKINCSDCNYNQKIISFLHGFGPNSWNNSGYQCQECGKFHEIEYDMFNSKGKLCECGGILSREKPVFCPSCKSQNMKYSLSYIT